MPSVAIKRKTVTRWYISGKGFNSLMAACRFEARSRLRASIGDRASEIYSSLIAGGGDSESEWQKAWRSAYGELFPPCEDIGCCWDHNGYDYDRECVRSFCVRARRAYIDAEAEKIADAFRNESEVQDA